MRYLPKIGDQYGFLWREVVENVMPRDLVATRVQEAKEVVDMDRCEFDLARRDACDEDYNLTVPSDVCDVYSSTGLEGQIKWCQHLQSEKERRYGDIPSPLIHNLLRDAQEFRAECQHYLVTGVDSLDSESRSRHYYAKDKCIDLRRRARALLDI